MEGIDNMEIYTAVAVTLLSALVLFVIGYFVSTIKKIIRKQNAVEKGVQVMLRYCIIQMFGHYNAKGHIPIYARENATNLLNEYEELGGNGTVKDLVDKLIKLPVDKPTKDD